MHLNKQILPNFIGHLVTFIKIACLILHDFLYIYIYIYIHLYSPKTVAIIYVQQGLKEDI